MDMGSITAAVSSLKVAGELAVGLVNLKTMNDVQAVALKLNQELIAAQHQIFAANAAQAALIQRVSELEKQIAQMEAWEAEKRRYQMVLPFNGATVYALKKSMSNGEPPHYICANCYQHGKRSILQNSRTKDAVPNTSLLCTLCKSEARTPFRSAIAANYAEEVVTQ